MKTAAVLATTTESATNRRNDRAFVAIVTKAEHNRSAAGSQLPKWGNGHGGVG
jgi:hypothetical protein